VKRISQNEGGDVRTIFNKKSLEREMELMEKGKTTLITYKVVSYMTK